MKKTIHIDYLSRVEGEGGLTIEIENGTATRVNLKIFEAPRFFESFLRARPYDDVIDFTARVCGICPVAYQMSSAHAIETIFGIEVDLPIRELRRLLYCGEWIESHALHVYLLQGPDFYGAESAWSRKEYLPVLTRGLLLKKLGNRILTVVGGRSVHPIAAKVGGFHSVPDRKTLITLIPDLEQAFEEAIKGISWAAALHFSDDSWDRKYVSLRHPREYPLNHGSVFSSHGVVKTMDEFLKSIHERQVEYSTALHVDLSGNGRTGPYLVGPLARVNLNHDRLPPEIISAMKDCNIPLPITNPQMGIVARSIELAYALHESIRIIHAYEMPEKPSVDFGLRAGAATWITEAPRGMLIHRYELDVTGKVISCTIIPPTSQNLGQIETDLRHFIQNNSRKPLSFLKKESEKILRSYDMCISCSVH